ncbi:GM15013 [Drosophila sechellia]|uniref:GM15013 n=1 Tax=Drosophila sechellia TaxID=7238 RepID=B4IG04_DROSE|nr:GM15013 [Drosophila sechellia]
MHFKGQKLGEESAFDSVKGPEERAYHVKSDSANYNARDAKRRPQKQQEKGEEQEQELELEEQDNEED